MRGWERFLSDVELTHLFAVIRAHGNRRDHALYALLANTGFRPSEALALTRENVHVDGSPPWVRVQRMKKRKPTGVFEEIEIDPALAGLLSVHMASLAPDPSTPLFTLNRRVALARFKRYAHLGGLSKKRKLYDLRHTAATRMYLATRDIKCVQAILGHENPDTSTLYAHLPAELVGNVVRSLPAII